MCAILLVIPADNSVNYKGRLTIIIILFWHLYQWVLRLQLWLRHFSSLSLNAETILGEKVQLCNASIAQLSLHLSKGCLTMIMFVAFSDRATSFSWAPVSTGATTLACSFGCLEQGNKYSTYYLLHVTTSIFTWDAPPWFAQFQTCFSQPAAAGCASS